MIDRPQRIEQCRLSVRIHENIIIRDNSKFLSLSEFQDADIPKDYDEQNAIEKSHFHILSGIVKCKTMLQIAPKLFRSSNYIFSIKCLTFETYRFH